jgi:hypothetical protein
MAPKLGFFEHFKGADTLLLSATAQEVANLAKQLQGFASSPQPSLQIEAAAIPGHPAQLTAVREPRAAGDGREFRWLCGPAEVAEVSSKLNTLAGVGAGHQYFALHGSGVQLLVSIGEYAY